MLFRASDVAVATGGTLHGADVELSGASFDTRTLPAGALFVPLIAERDGHDFIAAAVAAGAAATMSSRPVDDDPALPTIVVDDTASALLALARWAVPRLGATVVAVTGSVGKTSSKDLIAAAVGAGRRVTANERSFNNEQGLPVTVLNAPSATEVLVLEMGMRGFGQIAELCTVAPPKIGVVTRVAGAHTELVGDIDGVARAKAELVAALPSDGTAVLNADDERVAAMRQRTPATVVTYGQAADADVHVAACRLDDAARATIDLATPWGPCTVAVPIPGEHMASNAAAAVAVAAICGVAPDLAASGIGGVAMSPSRMARHELPSGGALIDDAYNANPTSMRAALETLAATRAARRIAVLGEMGELADPDGEHRDIAAVAAHLGIELVVVGTDRYGVAPVDDAVAAVGPIGKDTVVVVKASLASGLQAVAAALLAANT